MPEQTTQADPDKLVKVKMQSDGFDPAHGKMRADGVYEFPMEQATRYVKAGIASPAPATARTAREEDRAAAMRDTKSRAKTEALEAEMSAAWDVDVRSLEAHQFEAEAAKADAEQKQAIATRGAAAAATGRMPGPVNTTTEEETAPEPAPIPEPEPDPSATAREAPSRREERRR